MATNGVESPKQKESLTLQGIRAIIFDMDELMVNSHPVHMKVFEQMLRSYCASMEKDPLAIPEEAGLFGRTIPDILSFLHKRYKLPPNITVEKMNAAFKELLLPTFAEHVEPMAGVEEIIHACKNKGYILALASSSSRAKIDTVLNKLHLADVFDAIVSGEDDGKPDHTIRGKPAPDIFIAAAEKLGVKPQECLVLEDAKNGVEAAKKAGMKVVGVHNKFTFERLGIRQDLRVADIQVNSLTEAQNYFFPPSKE